MVGAVLIWYVGGVVIATMVGLEWAAESRLARASASAGPLKPLLWLAVGAAVLIFAIWPWVAFNLAENVSL